VGSGRAPAIRHRQGSGRGGIRTHEGYSPHTISNRAPSAARPPVPRRCDAAVGIPRWRGGRAAASAPASGEGGIRTLEGLMGPNALAGRRLKPLGHLSQRRATEAAARRLPATLQLPLLGSNQDSPDPESGVLPITPRGTCMSASSGTATRPPFYTASSTLRVPSGSDPHIRAGDGARTRDPQLGKLMLCQLSYSRTSAPESALGHARATCRTRTDDPIITNDVLYRLS
jgi:hypothetical protein